MKRTIFVAASFFALLSWGFFIVSSNAVEIKLRSPNARQEERNNLPPEIPTGAPASPEADSVVETQSSPSDASLGKKASKKGREVRNSASPQKNMNKDVPSDEEQFPEASSKELLKEKNARTDVSLPPITAEEWEKRYPKVPGATLMTVETLIPTKKLSNVRVLRVFTRIPRVEFVPRKQRDLAYADVEIPLDGGFRDPRPFDVAFSIEALNPQDTDRVLVVEVGSGYSSAILSGLVAEVYAVDAERSAVKHASDACKKLRYSNVFFQTGDPCEGRSDAAPFDKIFVTRAVESIPSSLIDQLKEGGLIVAPVGDYYRQYWILGEKKNGTLEETSLLPTRVDPLIDDSPTRDLPEPTLVGGGFEELDPEPPRGNVGSNEQKDETKGDAIGNDAISSTPTGWRDAWNFVVADISDSYEGTKVCRFANETIALNHERKDRNEERIRAATLPEERMEATEATKAIRSNQRERELCSQMRQSFAVDGSAVKKITVSGACRVASLKSRKEKTTAELARIEFFDRDRKFLGATTVVEAAFGPCEWKEFSNDVSVPARAKEATLTIGLLDGIGAIEFDGLEVQDIFKKSSRNH